MSIEGKYFRTSRVLFYFLQACDLFFRWALSTLFVDTTDEFPRNLTAATMPILHMNMMPAYSLNVHDMLKHKTLVLTKSAAEHIEEKLLFAQRRMDIIEKSASATTNPEGTELPFYNKFGSSF